MTKRTHSPRTYNPVYTIAIRPDSEDMQIIQAIQASLPATADKTDVLRAALQAWKQANLGIIPELTTRDIEIPAEQNPATQTTPQILSPDNDDVATTQELPPPAKYYLYYRDVCIPMQAQTVREARQECAKWAKENDVHLWDVSFQEADQNPLKTWE